MTTPEPQPKNAKLESPWLQFRIEVGTAIGMAIVVAGAFSKTASVVTIALAPLWFVMFLAQIGLSVGEYRSTRRKLLAQQGQNLFTSTERLKKLTAELTALTRQLDGAMTEVVQAAAQRADSVATLNQQVHQLGDEHADLKRRVEALKNTPLEAVTLFAQLTEPSERRSARRDYVLFVSGAVVSLILSIVQQKFIR